MKLPIDILDEIFRFTEKPQFVLYFKSVLSRQTIRVLYINLTTINKQCKKGNLQTIKYLHLIGVKCTQSTMISAIRYGQFEIVKYLHESIGVKCTEHAMANAGINEHLEIVKYLHETAGVKCTEYVLEGVIKYNYIEIIKYLHKNAGADFTDNLIYISIKHGCFDSFRYIYEVVECNKYTINEIKKSAINNDYNRILTYLYETVGVKYTVKDLEYARLRNSFKSVIYLHDTFSVKCAKKELEHARMYTTI